jgi:hypothetical protein
VGAMDLYKTRVILTRFSVPLIPNTLPLAVELVGDLPDGAPRGLQLPHAGEDVLLGRILLPELSAGRHAECVTGLRVEATKGTKRE